MVFKLQMSCSAPAPLTVLGVVIVGINIIINIIWLIFCLKALQDQRKLFTKNIPPELHLLGFKPIFVNEKLNFEWKYLIHSCFNKHILMNDSLKQRDFAF